MISLVDFTKPLPDIGLFAKTRSGKDEVYKIIDELGFFTQRVAFGDALKKSFFDTFPGIPKEPKPTSQLIHYGQSLREIDENVWVNKTLMPVMRERENAKLIGYTPLSNIYTDIRQPNEYKAVKDSGAIMVKVVAPQHTRVARMEALGETPTRELLEAPTELHLDGFIADYVIVNNGTLEDLRKEVIELIYKIQTRKDDK